MMLFQEIFCFVFSFQEEKREATASLFCYIGNCSAIPYIAKKALRATDALLKR